VPEQSHFETERMIYKKLGPRVFAGTEILSFTKLGAKIISEYKTDSPPYAEDTVREIAMLSTIRELQGQLIFYRQQDDAAAMLNTIGRFQREGISPQELLLRATAIENPRLKAKISDIALIYERYTDRLSSENFTDRLDEIRIAAGLARKHKYFGGKSIYADGFDGFNGGQFRLLEEALEQAANLTISLTADRFDSTDLRYITSAKLARKLKDAAEKRRLKVIIEIPANPLPERCSRINTEICQLSDIYSESSFVAAKIRELITTANYFQGDIAVLNPPCPEALAGAFSAYGITGFSDIPEPIIEKPVVRFVLSVLEAVEGKSGAVLDLIRSGFMRIAANTAFSRNIKLGSRRKIAGKRTLDYLPCGKTCRLSRGQIQLLARIAYQYRLDGEDWHRTFPRAANLENAELIRAEIMGKLTALSEKIKDATGDKITEALTNFLLVDLELGRTVADIIYKEQMGSRVDSRLNDEYRQLWEKIIAVFESLHSALKGREISLADYAAVLKSIFNKTLIAKPPQVLDCVTIGDLRRTRAGEVKVVFLMGANQGEFPKSSMNSADFTEDETEKLCTAGIFIEENRADRYHRERFLIGRAMSLPTEKLFITAPLRDAAWKEKQPSRLLLEQKEKIKNISALPLSFWASHKNALGFLSAEKPHEISLKQAIKIVSPPEYRRLFLKENGSHLHKINCEAALTLMKKKHLSPSRIEILNTCLFKYFCAEGLKIGSERIKNDILPDALTRGNMTHYVLEKVLKNFKNFMELNPDKFVKTAENYIAEFEEKAFGGWARTARKREILLAHAAGIAEVLKQMREDFELSDFKPLEFEKEFNFPLGDILIKGKIDRIDSAGNAVRVVDYKTGSKEFSYPEIEFGLNLQALIYLFAVASLDENYAPSGAFYRLVNGGKLGEKYKPYGAAASPDDLYKNRLETQKTTGLHFGEITSDIAEINSRMKKNSASRREFIKLVNLEEAQFAELAEKAANQLKERLDALYSGDIRAVPVYTKNSPCEYCDYKNICNNAGKEQVIINKE
jgi:ATP-dependent helicase/nuclease subunit B